jgi:hypothetical protein
MAQGAPKKKKKKRRTYLPTFFLRFFEIFRSDLRKNFYGVFGLLMQRNGQKRDKKDPMGKDERKKKILNFFGQKFLTRISPKKCFMVFELPLLRNAQKRWVKTKGKKKKKPQLFRPKAFDMYFPQKVFNGVFELPLLRNAQKRHKKK